MFGKIREAICSSSPNVYGELCDVLRVQTDLSSVIPDVEMNDVPAETIDKGVINCDMVIVWGGRYTRKSKNKIIATGIEIGKDVLVFDYFSRRREVQGLKNTDVVIYVTDFTSHPVYHLVKGECRRKGVGFYHFAHGGHNLLIDFIREKFAV